MARTRSTLSTSIISGSTGLIANSNALHALYNAGGGGAAPFVAASDAPSFVKDRADWVCDGTADDVQIQDALSSHGRAELSSGTFNLAAGGITLGGDQTLSGQVATLVTWPGGTTGISIVSNQRATLEDVTLYHSGTAGQLVNLNGAFGAHFTRVRMYGQHQAKGTATYQSTYGVNITGNTGDCRFIDCDFGNLGRAFRSDSVQNKITDCRFTHNYIDVESSGSGCGFDISGSNFVAGTNTATLRNIDLASGGQKFAISQCWFEGADYVLRAGTSGGNGVAQLILRDIYSAASIIGYEFRNCRPRIDTIRSANNPATTQTNTMTSTGDAPYAIVDNWVVASGPSITWPTNWRVRTIETVQTGVYP